MVKLILLFSPSSSSQLAEWIVNYTPADNFSGTDEIRFTVENPNNLNGNSEIAVISINVSEVNDLPTFANVESIEFNEDENAVVELEFLDVDNDLLITFEDNEYINIQLASSNSTSAQLLVSSEANYYGVSSISILIQEKSRKRSSNFTECICSSQFYNDPPILNEIPNLQLNEDESVTIQLDASDLDFVSFDFSISNSNHINSDLIGNQLTLTPSPRLEWNEEFTVYVEDNLGLIDSQTFTLSVLPVNDIPSATSQSTELIEDGVVFMLKVLI